MENILILGIDGFSGMNFQYFIKQNKLYEKYVFIGADLKITKLLEIKYLKADLLDFDTLSEIIKSEKPDYIINFAGILKESAGSNIIAINSEITRNIFRIIVESKLPVKNTLLIGSAAEYGIPDKLPVSESFPLLPVNLYGLSKVIQYEYTLFYARANKIKFNMARTFNLTGKGQSSLLSVGKFLEIIKKANNGDIITVGNLNTWRDFTDINDAVSAYWKMLINGSPGEVYNVCSGKPVQMREILKTMVKLSGKSLRISESIGSPSINDVLKIYGDNTKIKRDLGWEPEIDISESLKRLFGT